MKVRGTAMPLRATDRVWLVRIDVEDGETGLLYATSPDMRGLLVTGRDMDELVDELPKVIQAMFEAEHGLKVEVLPASPYADDAPGLQRSWAAIPKMAPEVAARALRGQ